jgi:TetR/AcrR family transcriptional repressor of nem operon
METACKNPVGRPRKFCEEQALESAMELFWEKGYEATSLADLMAATGLHKGSIYQAFGDKHNLFILALKQYMNETFRELRKAAEQADSAIDAIKLALFQIIKMALSREECKRGCLAMNTVVEKAPHDPEIRKVLEAMYMQRVKFITGKVKEAQREGDLRSDWPPERITALIQTTVAGLAAMMKGPVSQEQARRIVEDELALLA